MSQFFQLHPVNPQHRLVHQAVDIVRQGRCTLVNTVQQQQILMLNCMISAFCLAVMHMQGSRSSEEQLISTGLLLTVASFAFSFAITALPHIQVQESNIEPETTSRKRITGISVDRNYNTCSTRSPPPGNEDKEKYA